MKTTVKHLSETKVLLTIALGKEELDAAELVALKKLSKEVKVAGFRKGHVPIEVVKKNVDLNLLAQETADNALSKAVAEAFMAENLQVLARPEVEVKKFVPGETLEFTAETEVIPPVKLGDYKKLKVKKEIATVSAEDIDVVIERIRAQLAEKVEVQRPARNEDEVVIDFVGKKDGVAFDGGSGNDYPLKLGSNSFIPGFEEGLVGKSAGEKVSLELTFPADYHAKDLAGQKVVFDTEVKKVTEVVLPEKNDELAAKVGPFTSFDELNEDIKKELAAQKEREAGDALKDEAVKQLVEKSTVPVPEVLVQDQIRSLEQDMQQNLMYSGMTMEMYLESKKFEGREDWIEKEVRPAAVSRVQAGLVLAELSKVLKIEATSDELAEELNKYRERFSKNEEMQKRLEEPEVQRDIANRLITEKTVNALVELNVK